MIAPLLVATVWATAASAQGQAEDETFARLTQLMADAPARQVGQEGNAVIDRWVHERFRHLVATNNDPRRQAEADRALEEVNRAEHMLRTIEAHQREPVASDQLVASNWFVHFTLESPAPAALILIAVALLFFVGWRLQHARKGLLIVSIIALAAAVFIPMLAAWVQTEVEQIESAPTVGEAATAGQRQRAVVDAMNTVIKADHVASDTLQGLWQQGRMHFPSAAFVAGNATLRCGDRTADLYQMAPNYVAPANLPGGILDGRLVYAGHGSTEDLDGKDFTGAVAVIEFESGARWIDAVNLGAVAIIVLEPPTSKFTQYYESVAKQSASPLSVPRFYVKRRAFLEAINQNKDSTSVPNEANIVIAQPEPGRWTPVTLAIDWLFIPGSERPQPDAPFEHDTSRQLVHIQAYKDAMSIVPAISPGATSAVNLVLLMQLAEHFADHPPRRPVMLSVVNDHTNACRGEQQFTFHAFAAPEIVHHEITHIGEEYARHDLFARTFDRSPTHDLVESIRTATTFTGGQIVKLRDPGIAHLSHRRNVLREIREAMVAERDALDGDHTADLDEHSRRRETLNSRITANENTSRHIVTLMGLFNRFGKKVHFDDLSDVQRGMLESLYDEISHDARQRASVYKREHERLLDNITCRRFLRYLHHVPSAAPVVAETLDDAFAALYPPLPAMVVLQLDLSFGTDRIGVFHADGRYSDNMRGDAARSMPLAWHLVRTARKCADAIDAPNPFVDTIRFTGGIHWKAHQPGNYVNGARSAHDCQVPGLSLLNVRDYRPRTYGPHDTADRIHRDHFNTLTRFVRAYLPQVVDSVDLGRTHRPNQGSNQAAVLRLEVRKLDRFAAGISKTRHPGALVAITAASSPAWFAQMNGQVRPHQIMISDAAGGASTRGMTAASSTKAVAYGITSDGAACNAATDMMTVGRAVVDSVSKDKPVHFKRHAVMTFTADKVDLFGLSEPLNMATPAALEVIDAQLESEPQRYRVDGAMSATRKNICSTKGSDGTASLWLEPGTHYKLRTGRGVLINAGTATPEGTGLPISTSVQRQIAMRSAADMTLLTRNRLNALNQRGVVTEMASDFIDQAALCVDDAQTLLASHDNQDAMNRAHLAQGIGYRAYTRALSTVNDLIKAVIFFLVLVIPFCYFLMKLVTPTTTINRQMMLFVGIFLAMAILLQMVHPAFAIAQTPTMVLLAFMILGLAGFVSTILIGQFNESMTRTIEEVSQVETTDTPRGRLAGVAFLVGVNNMKRRRIRTTLTCVTIVLVTFTMLSVISVGQDAEPVRLRLSRDIAYDGWIYSRAGMGTIEKQQVRQLRNLFTDNVTSVARVWVQLKFNIVDYHRFELEPTESLPDAKAARAPVTVLMGLEKAEDGFIDRMPLLDGGRWFSANDAHEIVISEKMAQYLGITPANHRDVILQLGSLELNVVGILDDAKFEAMKDLGETPFPPVLSGVRSSRPTMNDGMRVEQEQEGTVSLDASSNALEAPGSRLAEGKDVALIPIQVALQLDGAAYHSVAFKYLHQTKYDDAESQGNATSATQRAWDDANLAIQFQHARVVLGLTEPLTTNSTGYTIEQGQYALVSNSSTEISGLLKVAIPIVLAATIILNTMLGSVMERKREVAIYNAIGLNPGHVMMFFLAESIVFGLVGSVAGYIIGQGLSLVLAQTLNLNLNYSSTAVMFVIVLAIGTVLVSTIYPSAMAARAAVPSGQRRWALPNPEGDEIHVNFPFSYSPDRLPGVCAFLDEFMAQNSEASTGRFLAKARAVGRVSDSPEHANGTPTYVMVYDIAPAPFDLGVNQTMEIYAYYHQKVRAHMLSVHLTRVSGQIHNWKAVNQPFLESLRKRLLDWRSQQAENQTAYGDRGEAMFHNATIFPSRQA